MTRRKSLLRAIGASVLAAALGAFATTSCGSVPDSGRITVVLQPDFDVYKTNVDNYLRRRCGTLDCHGQPGRSYRIYGREGFRLYNEDAGLISGVQPTTDAERLANFQAIMGLEPEEMSRVVASQGADPNKLLFLRKPLRLERHKGGPAMAEDDPGYRCVVAWLRVPVFRLVPDPENPDDPDARIPEPIPPGQRIGLTPGQLDNCAEAEQFP